jgi:hypothetical protein
MINTPPNRNRTLGEIIFLGFGLLFTLLLFTGGNGITGATVGYPAPNTVWFALVVIGSVGLLAFSITHKKHLAIVTENARREKVREMIKQNMYSDNVEEVNERLGELRR